LDVAGEQPRRKVTGWVPPAGGDGAAAACLPTPFGAFARTPGGRAAPQLGPAGRW